MSRKNILLVQTVAELLIPVAGYFSWNWDYNFILLFYLIDLLLLVGLTIAKANKRISYAGSSERPFFYRLYFASLFLFSAAAGLIVLARLQAQPDLQIGKEIHDFMLYRDMGIQQGYVLVPLIVLNGILLYRREYLFSGKYRSQDMRELLLPLLRQALVFFGAGALLLGISTLVDVHEGILILATILGITAYRWFFLRNL